MVATIFYKEEIKWTQGQEFRNLTSHQTKYPVSKMTKYYLIYN